MSKKGTSTHGKLNFIFNIGKHFSKITSADGKKRIGYVFLNLLYVALAAVAIAAAAWLAGNMDSLPADSSAILLLGLGYIVGICVCAAAAIWLAIVGGLGQVVLIFASFIGIFKKGQRGANFLAFLLATGSILALLYGLATLAGTNIVEMVDSVLNSLS